MITDKHVFFWKAKVTNPISEGCLSQWYYSQINIVSHHFLKWAEQYMMLCKAGLFGDSEATKRIRNADTPKEVKDLGREVKNFNSEKWNKEKYNIVVRGNMFKFIQNPKLGQFLLSTGDKVLVEASPFDKIWGIGMAEDNPNILDESKWGQNLLGKALMEVRTKLRDLGMAKYWEINNQFN